MDLLIHKISFTDEVKFDYETSISPNFDFIKKELKEEIEFYIQQNRKMWNKCYIRLKYYDEQTESYLMYFLRSHRPLMASMKIWNVVGVCKWDDWDEELEEEGRIKAWLDTSLTPNENEQDWVEVLRFRQAEEERLRKIDEEEQKKYEKLFGH